MLLQRDPSLAEAPGLTPEQLEALTAAVSAKQLMLEADINAYIKQKQGELAHYERDLLARYREMECTQTRPTTTTTTSVSTPPLSSTSSSSPAPQQALARQEDGERRQKHTRVHKREQELFGLVTTPFFLPLLDARDTPSYRKRGERPENDGSSLGPDVEMASPPRDAASSTERRSRLPEENETEQHSEPPSGDTTAVEKRSRSDSAKRTKRPAAMKKSSLRNGNEKSRRKRVSLVIDDQIVLPADVVPEPPLTSPSDTAPSSVSTSTTSLEEMIDPRLMSNDASPQREHQETIQDDSTSSNTPSFFDSRTDSPTILTKEPDTISHSAAPIVTSPVTHEPPSTTGRTFLDPSPPQAATARNIRQHASSAPIYASFPERAEAGEEEFSSYVGGIDGSGVDNVNQIGSLGFPSSLGASYMESYMKNRPLSVRMAAAEKAGLNEDETAALVNGRARLDEDDEDVDMDMDSGRRGVDVNVNGGAGAEDEEMVVGSMEGL